MKHCTSTTHNYKIRLKNKASIFFLIFFLFSIFSVTVVFSQNASQIVSSDSKKTPIKYKGASYSPFSWEEIEKPNAFREELDPSEMCRCGGGHEIDLEEFKFPKISTIDAYLKADYKAINLYRKEIKYVLDKAFEDSAVASSKMKAEELKEWACKRARGRSAYIRDMYEAQESSKEESNLRLIKKNSDGALIYTSESGSYFESVSGDHYESHDSENEEHVIFYGNGDLSATYHDYDGLYKLIYYATGDYSIEFIPEVYCGNSIFSKGFIFSYAQSARQQQTLTAYGAKNDCKFVLTPQISAEEVNSKIILVGIDEENNYKLRIDYFPQIDSIQITQRNQRLVLQADHTKAYYIEENKSGKYTLVSLHLPEGISYNQLNQDNISSTVNTSWQKSKKVSKAGFDFFTVVGDRQKAFALDDKKLVNLQKKVNAIFSKGFISGGENTPVVIPSNLENYGRLLATYEGQYFSWYPSAFQLQNYIVMWPLSLNRYEEKEANEEYEKSEFYQYLAHEYMHLQIAKKVGYFNQIPVWLSEGLCVIAEGTLNKTVLSNWEEVFYSQRSKNKLLKWEQTVTQSSTAFSYNEAQSFYAQSYMFTKFLIEKYGIAKIEKYILSFKSTPQKRLVDTSIVWKPNFKNAFGVSFEEAASSFNSSLKSQSKR